MKRFLPLIFGIALFIFPLMMSHSCANTTQAPSGGDKDTIPPYIVNINPLPGATGVPLKGAKFEFTFNEYVSLKNAGNVFLSPPQAKRPVAKLRGKKLVVSFEDSLQANTTYTISFTDALADANEGNMFAGYTYVFSTGDKIDSMMFTGTIRDCNTLAPVKGATVMIYTDRADSAIFLRRPYAAAKTDDWGFFCLPFVADQEYRMYALKDDNSNNLLDPDTELVGFVDSLVRPVLYANDTVPEMLRYDMLDTLSCLARHSEYEISLFKETPLKQMIMNYGRNSERSAYLTFMARNAIVDSIAINDFRQNQIISQFNIERDSLELWINSRRAAPDTMHISVTYHKTDSTGALSSQTENIKLSLGNEKRTYSKRSRRDLNQNDTTCVFKLEAKPETVEQNGFELTFNNPIIYENFDSLVFSAVTPRQTVDTLAFDVEQDSLNLRRYIIRPKDTMLSGYEYKIKVPHEAFRDINGYYSDSTEVKVSLPTDDKLSTLETILSGVSRKYIVDLLNERRDQVIRKYIIDSDTTLVFPYIKEGKYSIRITEDLNRNSIVDAGSLLEHRQPERVKFYEIEDEEFMEIPAASELVQEINIGELFK